MKWIENEPKTINGLTIREFKCPVCGLKETVHEVEKLPKSCYVCETALEVDNASSSDS